MSHWHLVTDAWAQKGSVIPKTSISSWYLQRGSRTGVGRKGKGWYRVVLELATPRDKSRPDLRKPVNGDDEGELERQMWPAPCGSLLFIAVIRHSDQNQLTYYSPSLRAGQELIAGT